MTATVSKSQLAYRTIKERISDGSYSPGYRLVLGRIAEELGVSAVPVREAIRMLEAEGLVQFERNVGAQVAMLDPTEYQVTMQTLALVEGFATAVSAPHMTPDDVARARAINDAMARTARALRPGDVHPAEPGLPRGAVRALPQPARARPGAPRVGTDARAAGVDVQFRSRAGAGVGGGARRAARPD